MAPLGGNFQSRESEYWYNLSGVRRDGQAAGSSNAGPMPAQDASEASTTSPSIYLGLGLGVGGAILIAVIIVVVQIARRRSEHKRMMEAMEVEQAVQMSQRQETGEIPRSASAARYSSLISLQARAGWGALSSQEAISAPEPVVHADKRKRSSVSFMKKHFKHGGIPLKRLKRLTAILESPRSRTTASPAVHFRDSTQSQAGAEQGNAAGQNLKAYTLRKVDDGDVFVCPGSPKPAVLPSFAIRSPGRYGAGIANNDNPKAARTRSVGALMMPVPDNAVLGQTARLSRPPMHARSISLGAPSTRPPSGPVPPLPVIAPHSADADPSARQGVCVSRLSCSSQESTGSSVLITSPILQVHERDKAVSSPRVEELIAEDDSASLKTVSTRQWQKPLLAKTRPFDGTTASADCDRAKSQVSIRSNIARYSVESLDSHRLSSASTASSFSQVHRLSIPQIHQADQVSISRVSSTNSIGSYTGVKKITTPKKSIRNSVSAYGSPAERKKTGVLRSISGNSITPSRQSSNATQDSGRSSNGNPFQWDNQRLPKPSALKGSPNARKGHRRQNCVRISTLTPQILGPPPSRPTSPSIMHGIEEESGDGEEAADANKLPFVSNQRPSRPPSASSFVPNLRIQTLRASLTPSSPTLSAWTAFQEHGLPSQHSDSQLSASPTTRSASQHSSRSSAFSIPSFPSPVKPSVSDVQLSKPVPEFYLSRPSTDIEENESLSPFALNLPSDPDVPPSPPLPISKHDEYDPAHPAWPIVNIPAPQSKEYDPASPVWDDTEPERSSPFLPFAAICMDGRESEEISPRSRPTSYGGDMPDTPPISPKTMPDVFQAFFDKQESGSKPARTAENLTSANASAIMARTPSRTVDFPGAPILPPPEEPEEYYQQTPPARRQRAVSDAAYLQPSRPAPSPPIDTCMPSPLHLSARTSPRGPRMQPAQSVLKHAMALRRMNSEVNDFPHRESRRYVRLGREASPLLPWIGSPNPSESCGDMNELFDFGFASAGAEDEHKSALDEIDMTEVERRLDGAIAGFDAIPSDDGSQKRSSSVWEDGERYWEQVHNSRIEGVESSPLRTSDMTTPKKAQGLDDEFLATPRSIQMTPKSLYDSDGFLRT